MTKKPTTHIAVLLDESGSMSGNESDVIGGTNSFVKEQKSDTEMTIFKFGTHLGPQPAVVQGPAKAGKLKKMTGRDYQPCGGTNLLDAVGYMIQGLAKRADDDDVIVCFIFTDGLENASVEFDGRKIDHLIKKRKKDGWLFLFAGADLKDFDDADQMGIAQSSRRQMSKAALAPELAEMSLDIDVYEQRARALRSSKVDFDADEVFNEVTAPDRNSSR